MPDDLGQHRHSDAQFLLFERGRLRLTTGEAAAAVRELLECGNRELTSGTGNPGWIPWRSTAAAALGAVGDPARARALAEEKLALARGFGAPRSLGIALQAKALIERRDSRIDLLREAVAVLQGSQARLEHARALIGLGTALRGARDRAAARTALQEGMELATSCGAAALAEQARAELIADGARPRRHLVRGPDALTARELRVARMAAEGRTNREIAQALFVTVKAVEWHLGNTDAKLAIDGRGQLASALAAVS